MTFVYNKNKCLEEPAELKQCPRCKGFEKCFGDEELCYLCKGFGSLWVSKTGSGWTRALHARQHNSKLF